MFIVVGKIMAATLARFSPKRRLPFSGFVETTWNVRATGLVRPFSVGNMYQPTATCPWM